MTRRVAKILTTTASGLFALGLAAATSAPAQGQASATWSYTGSLPVARQFHTATLFSNGQVLVLGGFIANEGDTARADLYDPSTGTWTSAGTLENGIFGHTATLLANGEVFVTGGITETSYKVLESTQLYNPFTETSSYTGAAMSVPRVNHSAVRLPNAEVLIAGGFTKITTSDISGESPTNSADLYNPTTNTITATASMNYARVNAPLTLLPNGEVLIAGGGNGDDDASCTAELFSNGQWTLTSPLAICGVTTNTAALLPNGDVLIDAGSASQFYDPSTNVWEPTLGAVDINVGPLALLANGEVLVAGVTPAGEPTGPGSSAAALYDPSTNEWTPMASLKQSLSGLTLTTLLNGQVLAAGGELSSQEHDAELFTP
jgi:N-acetylneuraminic acid mutarotase